MKLISLNVEGNRHWEQIIPFLEKEQPDVLCLQELFDRDADMLAGHFQYMKHFVPMTLDPYDAEEKEWLPQGIGIFSHLPLTNLGATDYHSPSPELRNYNRFDKRGTCRASLAFATVVQGNDSFVVGTTHLSVTPDGLADAAQRSDFAALLEALKALPPHLVCGDFNMPRGYNDLYEQIPKHYTDEIPKEYQCSLDPNLHRVARDPIEGKRIAKYMVDYIFTTAPYKASNVHLQFGVSDHAAVIADITKQ